MSFKIKFSPPDKLFKKIESAIADLISDLDQEFEAVIEDPEAFPGFENSLVASGKLRDSQRMIIINESGKIKVRWDWDPVNTSGYHYAKDIFVGFYSGDKFVPGRDWPGKAVERIQPVLYLRRKLK